MSSSDQQHQNIAERGSIERYIPPETSLSLSSDAPGYRNSNDCSGNQEQQAGPTCWKCKGSKEQKRNLGKKNEEIITCKVCRGKGFLQSKKRESDRSDVMGQITRSRKCPEDWKATGPEPASIAFTCRDNEDAAVNLVRKAELECIEVDVPDDLARKYDWLPQRGEQLCNLVGRWRILQHQGGHRWTTDDLVTAYVAGKVYANDSRLLHLDLGCGNGSVLQMVAWRYHNATCVGIEAREQAVNLARRSILYNVGAANTEGKQNDRMISVRRGDFRKLMDPEESQQLLDGVKHAEAGFDLVTGTPPYFRVDFTLATNGNKDKKCVQNAVINQGGMPSCLQSAPARCEFRGGIEAYCEAASAVMKRAGVFVVCENWLNNDRVYKGANAASLKVVSVLPVAGKTRKNAPLFAVYTMRKVAHNGPIIHDDNGLHGKYHVQPTTHIEEPLYVRDDKGNWTAEYAKLLKAMSIPVPL